MHHEEVGPHDSKNTLHDDLGGLEPALVGSTIEHDLQRPETEHQDGESKPVEPHRAIVRGIFEEQRDTADGGDTEGHVDVEYPAPAVGLGQVTAEGGSEDGPEHDAHAPD